VRDVARELGKDVQLVTEGREIELDRSLLDAIGDPLVHLLRNALDHGIEDPESRRANGKPPTGTLILRAARDRAAVVLQVEDDGRGIDRAVILRRALQQPGVLDDAARNPDSRRRVRSRPSPDAASASTSATRVRAPGARARDARGRRHGDHLATAGHARDHAGVARSRR
jgi:two-component system chemotaxis sensor kinase CheA